MLHPHRPRRSRRSRLFSLIPVLLVIVASGAFVYVSKSEETLFSPELTAISIDQAVAEYRADSRPKHEEIRMPSKMPVQPNPKLAGFSAPKPGVYSYRTTGKDWVEYDGQKYTRQFPKVTPATVLRSSGCGWELYFRTAREYTDGHRQCSAPGEFLCMAHISDITFGDVHRSMTHECNPGMVQVGGKAVGPGGRQSTKCYASHHDAANIDIIFRNTESVVVGGKPVEAYHVELLSSVKGELKGTAVADVWFETRTGTYLKMTRKQDTSSVLPDGSTVTYRVRVTYELESLEPRV
ncbi:hypothetical protein [Streptomyces vietnamensis]|uniref:hypothetical protein n=1 Tax=Streptomyces vietnamensis TaxID=362257 RepID=UPI0034467D03